MLTPRMVTVADPGAPKCLAGALGLATLIAHRVVLDVLVLAAAAQHPGTCTQSQ